MSRRKQSVFEDLIDIAAALPWWAGVVLAAVVYLVLHQFAVMEVVAPTGTRGLADFAGKQMYKTLASIFQYVFSAAFLIGALISFFARRNREALHTTVANSGDKSVLENMSWQEFEQLVGEYFRHKGYDVQETGGGGADGGVDLVASLDKDRYFVQCKQWKARQVGVAIVRELYGVMAAKGAAGGFVVTSGKFTDEAQRFAEGREIKLIAGDQLTDMIRSAQPLAINSTRTPLAPRAAEIVTTSSSSIPACPRCGASMILRTARKGSNAGNSFWGCSTFPKCKGILSV